ncbi:conserved oligomeric Golgi complex subunit 5 [Lingula anatina]|uniref:Conserved oligomeric Golgi complex subunit 5 n=1 Tax=Lingula anatina TaxID=7574 RepID=A0A2R2MQC6_LINAN|nr:conserved oligomeric Golgi complex subunit 5 [Lingula anatina]|eukprot:XP_023932212.1 conserved oligomeric Golgi complex subunit 5 [Lingula anatina]
MEENLFGRLDQDDSFKEFLHEQFDVKTYANQAIQAGVGITQQLGKLAEGISLLDRELHSQVVAHHEDLLSQATGVETLEGVLQMMQTRIQSLLSAVERIRGKVVEPYTKIITRTSQLRRLQETCDLLRRIIRILYLSKRLHGQLQGGAREITKAAQSLNELDYLSEGVDLSGIDVVESDRRFIKQARKEVEAQAQKMLEQGMETQNQTQVATSLQVFHNLGSLHHTVTKVIEDCKMNLQNNIKMAVDVSALSQQQTHGKAGGPGKAAIPATGNTAMFRANLWTNMEKLMDNIYSACAQVQHLQKVLVKKKDPVTHVCFIDELSKEGPVNIMQSFWVMVTCMLKEEFTSASNASTFLKQAFEGEYPKLLRLYNELWKRLQQFSANMNVTSSAPDVPMRTALEEDMFSEKAKEETEFNPEHSLRESLSTFETAYISRSLSRLFDPINLVFSGSTFYPPTAEEVDSIVKTISSELNVASVDNGLSVTIARNVAKTVKLFAVKCEQLEGPVNIMQSFWVMVTCMLKEEFTSASNASTFLKQAFEGEYPKLLRLYNELWKRLQQFSANMNVTSSAPDVPMRTALEEDMFSEKAKEETEFNPEHALRESLSTFETAYISRSLSRLFDPINLVFSGSTFYPPTAEEVDSIVKTISSELNVASVDNGLSVTIARNVAKTVKLFAVKCEQLVCTDGEASQVISPSTEGQGRNAAVVNTLFQLHVAVSKVKQSYIAFNIVPYSTALHFLFARGPQELCSPHQAANWSISRYSQWLDDHPAEKERLALLKGTLESYVQTVRVREGKEFAAVYPVMLDLLQRGMQTCS